MNIAVIYIYPMDGNGPYADNAITFISSYNMFPAGADHTLYVVCNGHPVTNEARLLFSATPAILIEHDNSGYDIGAFQRAAREIPCDLMVFFGSTAYLRGPNWLVRMRDSFQKHGRGIYGTMANCGMISQGVYPHIRTTGFWMDPGSMNEYPHKVTMPQHRYGFEHAQHCITQWCRDRGRKAMIVTWSAEHDMSNCASVPDGYHVGGQEGLICGDRMSKPPYYPMP